MISPAQFARELQNAAPTWGGPVLAGAAFLESVVIIGVMAPATPLIVAAGVAIAARRVSPEILLWAAAGVFAGNWVSFEAGAWMRRTGKRLPGRLGARVGTVTHTLFARYGPAAVVIGRFLGPVGGLAPFAAGWGGMRRPLFLVADVATALVWPAAMAAIGYFGVLAWFGRL